MKTLSIGASQNDWLVQEAITALRERLHINANVISVGPYSKDQAGYDAEIEIIVDGLPRNYHVDCRPVLDRRATALQAKQRVTAQTDAGLLITPHVTREIASYCRDIDLQFIDTHGNAFLKGPGLLVYVAGERHAAGVQAARSAGVSGVAGLRIACALLSRPDMVAAPYREIASKAGVSLGAVSNALEDLEQRGYVIGGGPANPRQLLEPARLLDEWALNYPMQLRPKLNGRRYSVPRADWWKEEPLTETGAVWGGEVAAMHLNGYLRPSTQTIYVDPSARSALVKRLVMSYHAKPDPNGTLEILDKFWGESMEQRPDLAPFALVYADLLESLDPRAGETAQLLRQDWIDHA